MKKSMQCGFDSMETRLNEKFKSYADVTAKNITKKSSESNKMISSIEKNLSSVKENIEKKLVQDNEMIAKQRKINNVIIFNIPEAGTGDKKEDIKQDLQNFRKIIEQKVTIVKEDITAFYRIPTERINENARPIIVTLSTNEKKTKLLRLKNLKFMDENNLVHNVYIKHDRTKKEQQEYKKLIAICKNKRAANPEKNFIVRNGGVIEVEPQTPFRLNPQMFWG